MPEVLTKISDLTSEQKSHLVGQMMGTAEGRMHMAHSIRNCGPSWEHEVEKSGQLLGTLT